MVFLIHESTFPPGKGWSFYKDADEGLFQKLLEYFLII